MVRKSNDGIPENFLVVEKKRGGGVPCEEEVGMRGKRRVSEEGKKGENTDGTGLRLLCLNPQGGCQHGHYHS